MRSIGGCGSKGAVVSYCFGEEKGAEEEEERFSSVMIVRTNLREFEMRELFTFPRKSFCIFSRFRVDLVAWLRLVKCTLNVRNGIGVFTTLVNRVGVSP